MREGQGFGLPSGRQGGPGVHAIQAPQRDDIEEKRPPAPALGVPLTHAPDPEPA